MRRLALLVVTIVTMVLFSTMPLQAASSREYPNSALACGVGNVPPGGCTTYLRASYLASQFTSANKNQVRLLDTGQITFPACSTGAAVVDGLVTGLGTGLCPAGSVPGGCLVPGPVVGDFTCSDGSVKLNVNNDDAAVPNARMEVTPGNNTTLIGMVHGICADEDIQVDLLPDLQVQVTPRGFDGNVDFHVEFVQGGGPSFTVNTTSKKPAQIHKEIADGFKSIGYPVKDVEFGSLAQRSQYPDLFAGSSVRVSNIGTLNGNLVRFVKVKGVAGMQITVEDSVPIPNIPAVSEWTVALFIGLLLLMGTWLLRRRLTTQAI
jgi:hypothetical protein